MNDTYLRRIRIAAGYTPETAARALGIAESSWRKYEAAGYTGSDRLDRRAARLFGGTQDYYNRAGYNTFPGKARQARINAQKPRRFVTRSRSRQETIQ